MTAEHRRYDSDEFNYSGCVTCDTNGDTLGWPCPTMRNVPALPEQLSLGDAYPDLVMPDLPAHFTIQQRFTAFHNANPQVFIELRRMALELVARGHERISAKMLVEAARYSAMRTRSDDGWKLSNTLTSRYARLLADSVPELAGKIELRKLKAL